MTDRTSPVKPPTYASPARRLFHTLIAIGGWALFVYWWWIVFHRVSRHEVRFTVLFIAFSLLAIVAATLVWAWHNLRIFRRKGPRRQVREVEPDYTHDRVGRRVTFTSAAHRSAPVVFVRLAHEGKTYEPAAALPPRVDSR